MVSTSSMTKSSCRGRWRVLWRHRLPRSRGRAKRDTRGSHGTGESCSRRVSVDGWDSRPSDCRASHPSIRNGTCDLALGECRCTTVMRPR